MRCAPTGPRGFRSTCSRRSPRGAEADRARAATSRWSSARVRRAGRRVAVSPGALRRRSPGRATSATPTGRAELHSSRAGTSRARTSGSAPAARARAARWSRSARCSRPSTSRRLRDFGRSIARTAASSARQPRAGHAAGPSRRAPTESRQPGPPTPGRRRGHAYPAGGFDRYPGGATTGNIENLVTSELVYTDDDEPTRSVLAALGRGRAGTCAPCRRRRSCAARGR